MRILKIRGLPPWDLTTSVLVAASALVLSMFPFEPVYSSAGTLLFVLALLLPGYLISIALFPRRFDLAGMGRLALSIASDVLIILVFCILLFLSPWGLSPSSLVAALAIISLIMAPIAHFVRSPLPRWNRFVPFISGSGRMPLERRRETSIFQRVIDKIPLLAIVVLVAVMYNAVNTGDMGMGNGNGIEDIDAPFTEFYIQGANGEDHPLLIVAGNRTTTVVRVTNHELDAVNYTLQLVQNSSILSQKEIILDQGQAWEGAVDYALNDPGSLVKLDFILYKDGDFSVPYSEDHIWFNVSDTNATSEKYIETSDEDSITPGQSRKVVVLSADMDDSKNNGDKRSLYLSKTSPASPPAPSPVSSPASSAVSSQTASQTASGMAEKPQSIDKTTQSSLQEMESELSGSSEQKNEGHQASSENASPDVAVSGSTHKNEITEGKEKLVATAVDIEKDVDMTVDTEKNIATAIDTKKDTATAVNGQRADASGAGSPESEDSKASDSVADSGKGSSPAGADETKEPAKDDTQAPSADQEASSPSEDDKNDVTASKAGESASQKEEAKETSEIDKQIDSWVNTRGFSKSSQGHAFTSKDIQYVKKGGAKESAVLGRQSKEPVRLG